MAKFAQYYLKYNLEHMFSAEYKDQRQQIFGAFFETNESIDFVLGEGEDQKVYKHQVYHLSQNKDIIVMRIANDRKKTVEHAPAPHGTHPLQHQRGTFLGEQKLMVRMCFLCNISPLPLVYCNKCITFAL